MKKSIGIVGAGLSGLSCALELQKCGHDVHLFEKNATVGGRVRTDNVDGFLLDHGFQIYLSGYEKGQYFLDYKKLGLKNFAPGALIWHSGSFRLFSDPLRKPKHLLTTLISPIANLRDKLLMLKLRSVASEGDEFFKASSMTTIDFLKSFGFSYHVIEHFFRPFFSGVFLTNDLKVDHHYFLYLFHKFGTSYATLPKEGMQAIPEFLLSELGEGHVSLNQKVTAVSEKTITTADGQEHSFDHVVVSSDEHEMKKLMGDESATPYYGVTTHYYKTTSKAWAKKYLYLNTRKERVVNHVACLSRAQKSYAPQGQHLFSVNCLTTDDQDINEESSLVRADLVKMFGAQDVESWQWMKSYNVKYALNKSTSWGEGRKSSEGVFLCGDYQESPSIQGAMTSGFKTAHDINIL